MLGQGCSQKTCKYDDVILDRIAGLEKVIAPELIDIALVKSKVRNRYKCVLNNQVMVRVVLAMGLFTDMPIRQVFKACKRLREGDPLPARSSLCMARQRVGSQPLVELFQLVVKPLATEQTPGAFYKGMRLVAIDGTVLDVPDCEALQYLGRSSGSRGDAAFPQIRKVSLIEIGTHIELSFAYGGWKDSERALVNQLWKDIPDDALLLEDRGFFSYPSWKNLHEKHKLLIRGQKSMVLQPIEYLADGSYLARIYPSNWYRENNKKGIIVRVIKYKLDDPQRTGHGEEHTLITNLLDESLYPATELIMLYHERWEIELFFDEQKTHQDPCRAEKTTNLRSETPDGIRQELYAMSLGHFVTRALMLQAAQREGLDVDRLSFKGCFQILKTRLPECDISTPEHIEEWYRAVIWEMSHEKLPPRRNRINPRVIKRKMSKWNKCRPEHRNQPPLTQTFAETIVMNIERYCV